MKTIPIISNVPTIFTRHTDLLLRVSYDVTCYLGAAAGMCDLPPDHPVYLAHDDLATRITEADLSPDHVAAIRHACDVLVSDPLVYSRLDRCAIPVSLMITRVSDFLTTREQVPTA